MNPRGMTRQLLDFACRTPEDIEALISDNFNHLQQKLGRGMNKTELINLLYQYEELPAVINALQIHVESLPLQTKRRMDILNRAQQILDMLPESQPVGSSENTATDQSAKATAPDWKTRFWDDAGLVCHEELRDIYALILKSEVLDPNSISLQTLRVLRYLDPQTAREFTKLASAVIDHKWIPWHEPIRLKYNYSTPLLRRMNEAGLVDVVKTEFDIVSENVGYISQGNRSLRLRWPGTFQWEGHCLTRAGIELCRTIVVDYDPEFLLDVGRIINRAIRDISWAEHQPGVAPTGLSWQALDTPSQVEPSIPWAADRVHRSIP